MRKPDFFIVGAPKSGTRVMRSYLMAHPDIFIAEDESHFFGSDLYPTRVTNEEQYLSYFSKITHEKRVGDYFAWYLYSKLAANEIKSFSPNASIIILLRNPVDMLYSLHAQLLYNADESIVNFEDALAAENDRKQGLRVPDCLIPVQGLFYREVEKYTEQVQRYFDVFGPENVHPILFDKLKRDTAHVYTETLKFLNVDQDFQIEFPIVNASKRARSKSLQNFLRYPPQRAQRLAQTVMPCSLREKVVGFWDRN